MLLRDILPSPEQAYYRALQHTSLSQQQEYGEMLLATVRIRRLSKQVMAMSNFVNAADAELSAKLEHERAMELQEVPSPATLPQELEDFLTDSSFKASSCSSSINKLF